MRSFPTVLIPFRPAFAAAVEKKLNQLGNPEKPPVKRALDQLRTIHFMSMSVVRGAGPAPCDADALPAFLVLEVSADGDARTALTRVATALQEPLRSLFHAAGLEATDPALLLIEHSQAVGPGWLSSRLGLCFSGMPGMSVRRIRREAALAWQIARMRDASRDQPGPQPPAAYRIARRGEVLSADCSALEKLQKVRATLWAQGVKWPFTAEPMPFLDAKPQGRVRAAVTLAGAIAFLLWPAVVVVLAVAALALSWHGWAALLVLLLAVAALGGCLARLRRLEETDIPNDAAPDAGHVRDVMDRENFYPKNLLVNVTELKPGWLRRQALRAAFLVVGQLVAKKFRPGLLANLGTIHSARWVLLPGARPQLLFLSNYDGALESYLEDFIQMAPQGVTAIWSNTKGFMRTRWLFAGGAADGDRLRRYVLRHQQPARFWYCAYPSLTTTRIRANAAICRGIASARTEEAAQAWLACFGASGPVPPAEAPASARRGVFGYVSGHLTNTRPARRVPLDQRSVPMLAFDVRNQLRHAECVMVRLAGNPEQCREWLGSLAPFVTFGAGSQERPLTQALLLAFTADAFAQNKLGLEHGELASFSPPFLNGMDAPCRARALGDVGGNAPENWRWGSQSNRVDVLLLAYDADEARLRRRVEALKRGVEHRHTVAYSLRLHPSSTTPAPGLFGFVDGVSQPWLRGAPAPVPAPGEPPLDAGEFILGYRDSSGYLPPSPATTCGRDLGLNGTYLVVRQIELNKRAFDDWQQDAAAQVRKGETSLSKLPPCVAQATLAAKVMGRWQHGSALAQNPAMTGVSSRNDFRFGGLDPSGFGCPLGSHARRANPRDSMEPGSDQQLKVSNRHRILRVGRRYVPNEPGEGEGLLFMCINADIGRQFEFIQQSWLLNRSFLGLEDETDPIIGVGRHEARRFTVQTSNGPVRLQIRQPFARTKGGAYFFMPGREALRYLAQDHAPPVEAWAQEA